MSKISTEGEQNDLDLYGKGEPKPLDELRASYERLMHGPGCTCGAIDCRFCNAVLYSENGSVER